MILFLWLLSLIHLYLWCIHFSNIHSLSLCACVFADGVVVHITLLLFVLFLFFFLILYDCIQCRTLATTSPVTDRFLACSKSSMNHCVYFSRRPLSRPPFFLCLILYTLLPPLCIWILIHFLAFCDYWWVVICIACFYIIPCSTTFIVHNG